MAVAELWGVGLPGATGLSESEPQPLNPATKAAAASGTRTSLRMK